MSLGRLPSEAALTDVSPIKANKTKTKLRNLFISKCNIYYFSGAKV